MADQSDFLKPSIPKFDGFYDHWAMLMENLLRSKEYWSLIEDGVTVAPPNATAEQIRLANASKITDMKVKNYLFHSIDREILETILSKETSKEIWDSMRLKYKGSSKVKRAQLQASKREFEVLEMREDETVAEYFARTMAIANKMTSQGERMEQVTIVEKILRSMTERFNYVTCSIEESNDVTNLSIDALQSSLIVHEQKMKSKHTSHEEQALKVANGGRGRGRSSSSRGRGRGRINKESVECYKCHKLGHYKNECPSWEESAKYAAFDDEDEMLLMAKTNYEEFENERWFLDSGCSNHMVGNKGWLYEFDESYRDTVKLGDDSRMNVMGKGNVKLNINGRTHVITEVYYIPGLKTNLLSIGQIQQKNVTIIFKNDTCKLYHDDRGLLFVSHMSANRMYTLNAAVITPKCLKVSKEDLSQLWHDRYAHLSIKGLNILAKKEMVKGLPSLDEVNERCVDCLTGKQHREAIPKQAVWRAGKVLELIHSDICGPINPTSNGGNRYFITFTDDFSRKTWVYFLKEKSSALDTFKNFKALVENESGCTIQCLRTDRGGEFLSNAFNEFCSNQGIRRQLTTAYTPQQNGVSERKNRTIMNMVRSMLAGRNVPKMFWPEAVKWATYVMNRSPTLSVKDVTPEEAWSGNKPSVHHFRVFGCLAFVHIPDSQRTKLDGKSISCIHLGISDESKGYKLYDPLKKKIIISRDVIFEEKKGWEWNKPSREKNSEVTIDDIEGETSEPVTENEIELNVDSDSDMSIATNPIQTPNESDDEVALPPRNRRPPASHSDYVSGTELDDEDLHNLAIYSPVDDPKNYAEAAKFDVWRTAMDQEIEAIKNNDTWELTTLPDGSNAIGVKWIYKTKYNEKGEIEKHKARLFADDF
ncbi:unnamed protein product [Trifolium pratense]|uniref:Uncharacterized protein n=1 Tax=Trifolium pratense TaxID=57577 RepID=A0ACB0M5A7_TRIPR|nr:unnamed protein product [Trifolium pratense]